jgi:hypothetical protein
LQKELSFFIFVIIGKEHKKQTKYSNRQKKTIMPSGRHLILSAEQYVWLYNERKGKAFPEYPETW